ncbi:MAG TPA: toluene-4-monooxygenase system B family protein [Candidatus Obscuribacterales bacterium]
MPIPLYGFLKGDTIGLLLLADETETMQQLAARLQEAASVRVKPSQSARLVFAGRALPAEATVAQAGMRALQRFDVIPD